MVCKLARQIVCAVIFVWGLTFSPQASAEEPSIPELVARLADPHYAVREAASQALLAQGERARAELERVVGDERPELARRARELLDALDEAVYEREISRVARERARNYQRWLTDREGLLREHRGQWLVIAAGICYLGASRAVALAAADAVAPRARHRYVLELGRSPADDHTCQIHNSLAHGDLALRSPLPLEIGADGALQLRNRVDLSVSPLRELALIGSDGKQATLRTLSMNSALAYDIVLDPAFAHQLSLARVEFPGMVFGELRAEDRLTYPAYRAALWVVSPLQHDPIALTALIPTRVGR
jgi:hypothetical protein